MTNLYKKTEHTARAGQVRILLMSALVVGFSGLSAGVTHSAFSANISVLGNSVSAGSWVVDPPLLGLGAVTAFAVFGASDVMDTHETESGDGTVVSGGMIGSNRSVDIGGTNVQLGIRAGANVSTGNGTEVGAQGIIANKDVSLGGTNIVAGDIHGGDISTGNGANLQGNVVSGDGFSMGGTGVAGGNVDAQTATLGNGSNILGTLTLPNTVAPSLGVGSTVGTLENDGDPLPAAPDAFASVVLPTPNTFEANSNDQSAGTGTLTLPPGIYGNLTSGNGATINLSAGEYVFSEVDIGGSNTINADTSGGKILIFVEGDISTGNGTDLVVLGGGTAEDVYLEAGGTVAFGGTNEWYGTVYSTQSSDPAQFGITTGNGTKVWGGLYSNQQIRLGGTNQITLVGPLFGTYTGPGPVLEADVVLNEIYPAPYSSGDPEAPYDREWVELYNGSAFAVDVTGWTVKVGATSHTVEATCSGDANKMQPYGGSTNIPAGGLLVLEFCNNGANNKLPHTGGGATVELLNFSLVSLDSHTYPNTVQGKSHQRIPDGGIWVDPEPTPGEPNRVSRQDLVDAEFTHEQIADVIMMLAARGEYLLGEEPGNESAEETVPEQGQSAADDESLADNGGVSSVGEEGSGVAGDTDNALGGGDTTADNESAEGKENGEEDAAADTLKDKDVVDLSDPDDEDGVPVEDENVPQDSEDEEDGDVNEGEEEDVEDESGSPEDDLGNEEEVEGADTNEVVEQNAPKKSGGDDGGESDDEDGDSDESESGEGEGSEDGSNNGGDKGAE